MTMHTAIKAPPRSIMSTCAKPQHKAAARMVGYALTLGDAAGYADLADVLALRLTQAECAGLAYACLRAMDDNTAMMVTDNAMGVEQPQLASPEFMQAAVEYRRARNRGMRR